MLTVNLGGSTNLKTEHFTKEVKLAPTDNRRLADLCGQFDENLRQIESFLGVEINNRGNHFLIIGKTHSVNQAGEVIRKLYQETKLENNVDMKKVQLLLQAESNTDEKISNKPQEKLVIQTHQLQIKPRSANQLHYAKNILKYDINFAIGPSGTGKTYLAVACAVAALRQDNVRRIILVRPAVEAGESLGFLPGTMAEKIDPYLRPLYDGLFATLGVDRTHRLIENSVIEVAPLAYMRGRTLNDAFIILDESQNTTKEQMKMFLTRIGFGSKAVITGDITQIDLPKNTTSGLRNAIEVLEDVKDIHFTFFDAHDVVRHPLVQKIVQAYEKNDTL